MEQIDSAVDWLSISEDGLQEWGTGKDDMAILFQALRNLQREIRLMREPMTEMLPWGDE